MKSPPNSKEPDPIDLSHQFGDLKRSLLRPGNVHSDGGWQLVLEPVVERYRSRVLRRYFQADAAFAKPEILRRINGLRPAHLPP